MRSSAGVEGWGGATDAPLIVKLKTVLTTLAPGPKGVEPVLMVRKVTCAAPLPDPSMTVAETIPLASEAAEALLTETDGEGCQVTGTLASGRPAPSSTRAVSAAGKTAP